MSGVTQLEWVEHPAEMIPRVSTAFVVHCGCGWRQAFAYGAATWKREAEAEAEAAAVAHRRAFHPYADEVPALLEDGEG